MENNLFTGKDDREHICVVGAGLAGSLVALLLTKLGYKVSIFEKRQKVGDHGDLSDAFGTSTSASKRSINLALSYRGMCALKEVGALDTVMKHAVQMPCRVVHTIDREPSIQPYGKDDQAIWSVSRELINNVLLDMTLDSNSGIDLNFGYSFMDYNEEESADGAYSSVREAMLKKGRVNFNRSYIKHGYKELTIPPKIINNIPTYALSHSNGLHIWPRNEFMLIAIPNPDRSFTATLFAPYDGTYGFNSIPLNNDHKIIEYFTQCFPDALKVMPNLVTEYKENPVGSLVTVRTNPWNLGHVVLLGDAAHAVVPFFGQGMNAGFEDGLILYHIIKKRKQCMQQERPQYHEMNHRVDLKTCAEEFSLKRQPAAEALADLCLEHYADMAAHTASMTHQLRKRLENYIATLLPQYFTPLYSMIAFQDIPYHTAVERARKQDISLGRIFTAGAALVGGSLLVLGIWGMKQVNNK